MSERLSVGDSEDRKLKRKIEEEPSSTVGKEDSSFSNNSSPPRKSLKLSSPRDSGSSFPKPVDPSNKNKVHQEDQNLHCCKYCHKKFQNSQALGGHQNAHRRERRHMNNEMNTWFEPKNSHLYPYSSLSPMSNFPSQGTTPLYHGGAHLHPFAPRAPNMSWPFAPSGYGITQGFSFSPHRFGMTSSWSSSAPTTTIPRQLNLDSFRPFSQLNNNRNTPLGGAGVGVGVHQGSQTESNSNDSSSEELDLSLNL